MLSEVTLLWNAGPSSFQVAAARAPVCRSRDQRTPQRTADKQTRRPSPAGTHRQPTPDTHEPDQPGSVPCTCAARLRALCESRRDVARTSHWQSSPSHREPCPECPRTTHIVLKRGRIRHKHHTLYGLQLLCCIVHSVFLPDSTVTKTLGDRNRIRGSTPSQCHTH